MLHTRSTISSLEVEIWMVHQEMTFNKPKISKVPMVLHKIDILMAYPFKTSCHRCSVRFNTNNAQTKIQAHRLGVSGLKPLQTWESAVSLFNHENYTAPMDFLCVHQSKLGLPSSTETPPCWSRALSWKDHQGQSLHFSNLLNLNMIQDNSWMDSHTKNTPTFELGRLNKNCTDVS